MTSFASTRSGQRLAHYNCGAIEVERINVGCARSTRIQGPYGRFFARAEVLPQIRRFSWHLPSLLFSQFALLVEVLLRVGYNFQVVMAGLW